MEKLSWFPVIHEAEARLAIIDSATIILWRSLLVVFATEFAVMLLLGLFGKIPFAPGMALLDGLLLSVIALPALYLVILRPVTALAAGQAAASAESRFETIARTVRDGIIVFDWERKIRFANPAIEKIFGYPPGVLVGMDVEALMPEDVAEVFREGIKQYRATGENPVIGKGPAEFAGKRRDGEVFLLEISVDAVMARTEPHFVVVIRDITERKRAEETLRGSEQKLRQILDTLPMAVRIIQEGKVVFANPADARLHGYESPEEEIGADITGFVAEEERDKILKYAQACEAGEEAPRWYETRARRRDGTTVHIEVTAERILHAGAPADLVVLRDLTERERLHMFEQILPVCCVCGRIRDDSGVEHGRGAWGRLDEYVTRHSNVQVSHGFCPDCYREFRKKEGFS